VITELTFKLRPLRPKVNRAGFGSLASLIVADEKVYSHFLRRIELISRRLAGFANHKGTRMRVDDRFVGSPKSSSRKTAQALNFCATMVILARQRRGRSALEQVEQRASTTADDLKWRVTLRPTDLVGFLSEIASWRLMKPRTEASHGMPVSATVACAQLLALRCIIASRAHWNVCDRRLRPSVAVWSLRALRRDQE